jgi:nitronate monooxygenase
MLSTPFCRRLGLEYPIIQAPIGSASRPELAAAVSNAGGLGMLAGSWLPLDPLREAIRATRALTAKPFGVNLVLEWDQGARLQVALDEGVTIISLTWGDPAPLVAPIKAAGAFLIHTVSSAAEAIAASHAGVDAVVAQGWEAGGHVRGDVAMSVLVPAVCDAVGDLPVIAAGGIGDGRGIAATLVLGAQAAWLGTRFLATPEANAHPIYRERILAAAETDTVHSELFDLGWPNAPHRTLANSTTRAWEAAGRPAPPHRPGEGDVVAARKGEPILRYSDTIPTTSTSGEAEALALYAGQGAGLVRDIVPAGALVKRLAEEAVGALSSLPPR